MLRVVLAALVLQARAGRGEERLLERVGAVAPLQLFGRLEREQLPAVENPDPVREGLGLGEVVRAEQDRRVVRVADLADEVLHLELRTRVEARGGLVQQQHHRRGQQRARECHLLLHTAGQVLHRLAAAVRGEADAVEDLRDLRPRLPGRHSVEARGVAQVLVRGHLLEEGRLHGHAVDETADRPRLAEHVVAEDARAAAVLEQQRREQPDQRRLARAVLAQDGHRLAAVHAERDALQRSDGLPAREAAGARGLAQERLAQPLDLHGRQAVAGAGRVRHAEGLDCLRHLLLLKGR
jgi:hypothetical protein